MIKEIFKQCIFCVILLNYISCKKISQIEATNQKQSFEESSVYYKNPFGILVSATIDNGIQRLLKPEGGVNLAHDLGCAYARVAVSNLQWYDAGAKQKFLDEYNAYTKSTPLIKVLLNVNWGEHSTGSQVYPGATPEYKVFIKDLLDTLTSPAYIKPAVIVVENEENNPTFHVLNTQADQDNYIAMLKFVIAIGHQKKLKVTNGGLTDMGVTLSVRDYLQNIVKDTARLHAFEINTFPSKMLAVIDNKFYTTKKIVAEYFINSYTSLNMDYENIHWYEPIKLAFWYYPERATDVDTAHMAIGSLAETMAYFNDTSVSGGKQLIVNEAGQITPATEITRELTCALKDLPYVIWYSGDRDTQQSIRPYLQYALHSTKFNKIDYTLRETGLAFKDNIANIIAHPNYYCIPQ